MKPYTKTSKWDGKKYKYPVVSKDTGCTYEVAIRPYSNIDERYSEGCVVTLRRKGIFRSQELAERFCENDNDKITVKYWSTETETKTTYDYNLINMANLIVKLYEAKNKNQITTVNQLEKDFAEFSKWNGVVK